MTINYTTLLGLAQPVTGTETGQWGDVVNDEITSLLEDAVANAATFSVTSGNVTLTTTNGASNQARMSTLIITGSPGTTRSVIAPSQAKIYQVINQSDSSVVIKGSATTGVTIAAGATGTVVWNGSDFVEVNSTSSGRIIKGNLQVTGNLQVDGNTQLGNSTSDTLAVTALVNSNLLFTDATYDIGASGATRPRDLFLSRNITVGGNTTLGDAAADTVTVNGTITSNLLFTNNTYDIGANGANSPRYIYLSGGAYISNAGAGQLLGVTSNSAWSSGYYDIGAFYVPNMTGGAISLNVGKTSGTNNAGKIAFNYAGGSGSASNYVEFGLFNNDGLLKVFGTGNVAIPSGSLGVGTNSPAAKLHVQGGSENAIIGDGTRQLYFRADSGGVMLATGVNQTGNGFYFSEASNFIYAQTNSVERLRITSAGDVGIGTSSPGARLQVGDAGSSAPVKILIRSASADTYLQSTSTGSVVGTPNGVPLLFNTNDAERARITSDGNLLVGETTSYGSARILASTSDATATAFIGVQSSATTTQNIRLGAYKSGSSAVWGTAISAYTNYSSSLETQLAFSTTNSGGTLAERARFTSSGVFALGTTASNSTQGSTIEGPYGNISFSTSLGNALAGSAYYDGSWKYKGNSTATLTLQDSNGIHDYLATSGTTGSAITWQEIWLTNIDGVRLDPGSLGAKYLRLNTSTSGDGHILFQRNGLNKWQVTSGATDALQFYSYGLGSEAMRITSGGELLVGDTTAQYSAKIYAYGSIAARNSAADGNYQDAFIVGYTSNANEKNIIRTAVSSAAGGSGFQFMVSNGGGSASVTESFRINRTSCTVVGSLSKGSGSFKINHPLPEMADTHHLVHSFIEGPQADNLYRGKVTLVAGRAEVNIDVASGMTDGTFVVLNRDVQCFTTNESDWTAVRGSVSGNVLTIEAQDPTSTATISWMVIGERQDRHMYDTDWTDDNGKVIVEPLKSI